MSGVISAEVVGEIILKTYTYFPEFFTRNYTLAEIFAVVRYNATILSFIANTTGLEEKVIQGTADLYLFVVDSMTATPAPPPSNATNT